MLVLAAGTAGVLDAGDAAHAEVEDEGAAVVEVGNGVAGAAAAAEDAAAGEAGGEERGEGRAQAGEEDLDLGDDATGERAVKRAGDGFGFREFGHGGWLGGWVVG